MRTLFAFALLCISSAVFGQMNNRNYDFKKFHFGISAAYTHSNLQITHSEDFINNPEILSVISPRTPGFSLNGIVNYKINRHLSLRSTPGMKFSERRLTYNLFRKDYNVEEEVRLESISFGLPLGLKFQSDRFYNNFRFYVLAGGEASYDFASNSTKRKAEDIVKLKPWEFSANLGFGFNFYFPMFTFSPEIKLQHGLNNLHAPNPGLNQSNVIDKLKSRMFVISLQVEG